MDGDDYLECAPLTCRAYSVETVMNEREIASNVMNRLAVVVRMKIP